MSLAPGTTLGPYELLAPLGAGGMGEVWKARDTKLGREVAIKFMAEGLVGEPDRLRRFEQEARLLAALSHPNIVQVFEAGEWGGRPYLVTELLEGASLRERLTGTALPARKAVEWALQVAQGLAAVHEKGILHRDLKPENLFLLRDGRLKILDFGLAKLRTAPEPAPPPLPPEEDEPTAPFPAYTLDTRAGQILGTLAYLSPEQARGDPVDGRSDLFSLGVILWELLAGTRPFQGAGPADLLLAIQREEPPPLDPALKVPPALERILHSCLAKEPEGRFHSAHDLAFALESLSLASMPLGAFAPGVPSPLWRRRTWALGGLAAVALAAGWGLGRAPGPPPPPAFTCLSATPRKVESACFGGDGRRVFFSARTADGTVAVFDLAPGDATPSRLAHPDALLRAVSPANELALILGPRRMFTGFRGTLAQAQPQGTARPLQDLAYEAAWLPSGGGLASINELSDDGFSLELPLGVRRELTKLSNPPKLLRVSRGGDAAYVAFDNVKTEVVVLRGGITREVWSLDPTDGQGEAITGLAWHPEGQELWCSDYRGGQTTLWALTPGARRLVWRAPGQLQLLDLAAGGRALLAAHRVQRGVLLQRFGDSALRDISLRGGTTAMDISRDGSRLLLLESLSHRGRSLQDETYLLETAGGSPVRLCGGTPQSLAPDGQQALVYRTGSEGGSPPGLTRVPTGPGQAEALTLPGLQVDTAVFFPDGRRLLAIASEPGRWMRAYRCDGGGAAPQPLTKEGVAWWFGAYPISPDGSRLVVFDGVRPLIIPTAGGTPHPIPGVRDTEVCLRWTEDGRGLYLFDRDRLPACIERLDLATGTRHEVARLMPPDPALYDGFISVVMTPDARTIAYNYRRVSSELYLVEGLR